MQKDYPQKQINFQNINKTIKDQKHIQNIVKLIYHKYQSQTQQFVQIPLLKKLTHSSYLQQLLLNKPNPIAYDNAQTWLLYWIINSLDILNVQQFALSAQIKQNIIQFMKKCQHPKGGFAGGDGQIPHLGTSYSADNQQGTQQAYKAINKQSLYDFFIRSKNKNQKGQSDLRATYIIIVISTLLNIGTQELFEGCAQQLLSCQNYQGGFSNIPGAQAHGGYTYCAVASLSLLGCLQKANILKLIDWLNNRQMKLQGGYNGRTNKLVDSCYSFWVGAIFTIINQYFSRSFEFENKLLYSELALQIYLIICCQNDKGGFTDQPKKMVDLYHSCYSILGFSLSIHQPGKVQIYMNDEQSIVKKINCLSTISIESHQMALQFYKNI